ncbi:hypothetical protein [Vibrio harveyi]|uniref:hypothetical protein n=1 Tax=Vibrio harveyi TaxID=669 RepID=UPI000D785C16|nr:hypothetical protein [Vibrio harveyi]GBL01804.1 hypothetical protein VH1709_contig00077-0113 [Vibrio harveyi]HDM8059301.1 hypothetical protein [Vibrio harveyi]
MEEVKKLFLEELLTERPDLIVSTWILNRVPVPFDGNLKSYEMWRIKLASKLKVDPSEVIITGSASFGVSLNPNKNYRFFDDKSDIDVAIISEYFFNTSWRALRNMGNKRHSMSPAAKQSVKDHVNKYIYWGTIATDKLLPYLPFSKEWQEALDDMALEPETRGREIKARIYKDFDSLRSYQANNVKNLRNEELEKGVSNV